MKNKMFDFNSDPLRNLMKSCDNEACRVVSTINDRISTSNLMHFGKWLMIIKDSMMERPVRESVRTSNAIASEINYLIDKRAQHYALIDIDDRNVFSKGITASEIKLLAGFNMHETMDLSINKKNRLFMTAIQRNWRLEPCDKMNVCRWKDKWTFGKIK